MKIFKWIKHSLAGKYPYEIRRGADVTIFWIFPEDEARLEAEWPGWEITPLPRHKAAGNLASKISDVAFNILNFFFTWIWPLTYVGFGVHYLGGWLRAWPIAPRMAEGAIFLAALFLLVIGVRELRENIKK